MDKAYVCIDLKSFYASVECIERELDPMKTNLVVADASRTEKTICLAVSPALKAYGIPGRARLFEVVEKIRMVNVQRRKSAPNQCFTGESYDDETLKSHPELAVTYLTATPQMAHYMKCSTQIYHVYLKYVSPDDIHVYSIDEVFIDLTNYLKTYRLSPRTLCQKMMHDVYAVTGITATAGIGTNLYLAKIAMDILAKHSTPDKNGLRIASLDEMSYRKSLWSLRPLKDFWRIGYGYTKKLEENGLFTMGDIARCSLGKESDYYNEELLYRLFGINAELLIDHAWGYEPCTMRDIKAYKPSTNSISARQVLTSPYSFEKARLVVREMSESMALTLVKKEFVSSQFVLTIGYDVENLMNPEIRKIYKGEITTDFYGRSIPKHAHGTANLPKPSSSSRAIVAAILALYDSTVHKKLLVRRITLVAANVLKVSEIKDQPEIEQIDLFTNTEETEKEHNLKEQCEEREHHMQRVVLEIQDKFGKNAILKGLNFEEGATAIERNGQIGGHKA